MRSEIADTASAKTIRYAQVWEDADVLLDALDVRPGDVCLSIASAGDNALALLTRAPARVIAVDLNPAQLACLELRVAAYRTLRHVELLELIGSRPSLRRGVLYTRCRPALGGTAREFWDRRPADIEAGIGHAGTLERYLKVFRQRVLPLAHSRQTIRSLFEPRTPAERRRFYDASWNTWRLRTLARLFFSRAVMERLGRERAFFRYAHGSMADTMLARAEHALTALDPATNPYVHWILTGAHGDVLPLSLRAEHFDAIRANLDRLEWHCTSLEDLLDRSESDRFDRYNLSDLFEYVSVDHYHRLLDAIVRRSRRGARLAYWNLLVPRRAPAHLSPRLQPLDEIASSLHARDQVFFYGALRVEQVQ
jgi:S-adenosylmethionine-diacylglycerol 3-amino-3-carboxypropyl transferase